MDDDEDQSMRCGGIWTAMVVLDLARGSWAPFRGFFVINGKLWTI